MDKCRLYKDYMEGAREVLREKPFEKSLLKRNAKVKKKKLKYGIHGMRNFPTANRYHQQTKRRKTCTKIGPLQKVDITSNLLPLY